MKRFITKTIFTIIIFFVSYTIVIEDLFYFASSETTLKIFNQDWLRIKRRIEASKSIIKNDTLYVGCSVSGQLLPFKGTGSNQLTTNGSTYVVGNYFLIKNSIENNKNINTVIYMSVPDVLGPNLARKRTYNYFVKPFYTFENKKEIMSSNTIKNTLSSNPLLPLCLLNSFKILQLDDYDYSNDIYKRSDSLSVESLEWLKKIKSFCEGNDVKFHLASPPVPKDRLNKTSNWEVIKKQVKGSELEDLFTIYFKTIIYIDNRYLKDKIHWKHDFIKNHRSEFIRKIKNQLPD